MILVLKVAFIRWPLGEGAPSRHFSVAFSKNLEIVFVALPMQNLMLSSKMTFFLGFGGSKACKNADGNRPLRFFGPKE